MQSLSRHRFQPRLEVLEDRLTPSTFTVKTNLDSAAPGVLSLRNAVNTAGVDTIFFAPNVHAITLTLGEIDITTDLNIVGPGAKKLTISGNNASRVFYIESG